MAPPAPELEPLYPTRTPKGPAKYKAAVAARGSRDVPLSGLRFKPPDVPPLQRTLTDGPQAPLECFTDSLGLDIIVYSWPANSPTKGVILFCHGLDAFAEAEFAKRPGLAEGKGYRGSWLELLNDAGYLLYSFDYQGMGFSESAVDGLRSVCFDYDDYVDEAVQLQKLLRERHPKLPMGIMGTSMGGCVALLTAERLPPDTFFAVAVCCPAVGRFEKLKAKPANKVLLPFVGCLSECLPLLPIGNKHVPDSDATREEFKLGLPRFNQPSKMRAKYCSEGLRAGEKAVDDASKLMAPLWIAHAPEDDFTDYAGTVALMAAATNVTDKLLVDDLSASDHNVVEADANRGGLKYGKQLVEWLDERRLRAGEWRRKWSAIGLI